MTRRRRISNRTYGQLALAALVVAGVIAVLSYLHATFPSRDLEPILEGVESVRGEEVTRITCRRTLPDQPPRGETVDPGTVVGLISSAEVVSCPSVFDPNDEGGPPVQFVGEVVGDVLRRDGGAWVLMNDDRYALETGPLPAHQRYQGTNSGLTVWLPEEVIELSALSPGRPDHRGDVLALAGRVHRTDPADGGGLTFRAEAAEVVAPAQPAAQPLHGRQAALAVLLVLAVAALGVYVRSASRPWSGT